MFGQFWSRFGKCLSTPAKLVKIWTNSDGPNLGSRIKCSTILGQLFGNCRAPWDRGRPDRRTDGLRDRGTAGSRDRPRDRQRPPARPSSAPPSGRTAGLRAPPDRPARPSDRPPGRPPDRPSTRQTARQNAPDRPTAGGSTTRTGRSLTAACPRTSSAKASSSRSPRRHKQHNKRPRAPRAPRAPARVREQRRAYATPWRSGARAPPHIAWHVRTGQDHRQGVTARILRTAVAVAGGWQAASVWQAMGVCDRLKP